MLNIKFLFVFNKGKRSQRNKDSPFFNRLLNFRNNTSPLKIMSPLKSIILTSSLEYKKEKPHSNFQNEGFLKMSSII
jgi:hypothetical protein